MIKVIDFFKLANVQNDLKSMTKDAILVLLNYFIEKLNFFPFPTFEQKIS